MNNYRNPLVTVDIIIEIDSGIILIERQNQPYGWALPGGFVDYGESLEQSAKREAKEETSLDITLIEQFYSYSDPERDPRHHSITTVFIATPKGSSKAQPKAQPKAQDDAKNIGIFTKDNLPSPIVFDHMKILQDYFLYKKGTDRQEIFTF